MIYRGYIETGEVRGGGGGVCKGARRQGQRAGKGEGGMWGNMPGTETASP